METQVAYRIGEVRHSYGICFPNFELSVSNMRLLQ